MTLSRKERRGGGLCFQRIGACRPLYLPGISQDIVLPHTPVIVLETLKRPCYGRTHWKAKVVDLNDGRGSCVPEVGGEDLEKRSIRYQWGVLSEQRRSTTAVQFAGHGGCSTYTNEYGSVCGAMLESRGFVLDFFVL